jgi:hypothetical protein
MAGVVGSRSGVLRCPGAVRNLVFQANGLGRPTIGGESPVAEGIRAVLLDTRVVRPT